MLASFVCLISGYLKKVRERTKIKLLRKKQNIYVLSAYKVIFLFSINIKKKFCKKFYRNMPGQRSMFRERTGKKVYFKKEQNNQKNEKTDKCEIQKV